MDTAEQQFEAMLAALPWEERKQKALRYRFARDRILCVCGGLLTKYALNSCGADDLVISRTDLGKPYLKNKSELFFNLSHSGNIVMCAVSENEVGADTEEIGRYDENILKKFTPAERQRIIESSDRDREFFRMWTMKESYMKYRGMGLSLPLNSFSVAENEEIFCNTFFSVRKIGSNMMCICTEKEPQISWIEVGLSQLC